MIYMVNNELFPYKIDFLEQKEDIEYVACRNAALLHINSLDKHIENYIICENKNFYFVKR